MRRRQEEGALKDYMREQRERVKNLDEQGLCLSCEESPQNPELDQKVCLDCWTSSRKVCGSSGCINAGSVSVRQGQYCRPHAAEMAREEHKKWLNLKEELEKLKEEKEEVLEEVEPPSKRLTDVAGRIHDVEKSMSYRKRKLKDAIRSGVEIYPDEYDNPGELP